MIDRTDLDLRYAAHVERTARANQDGWMREASVGTGGTRKPAGAFLVALSRWIAGLLRRAERTEPATEQTVAEAR
jgi:hypothetical protein